MPKVYPWQEKYSCNLKMIDEQHQFFLRLLTRIGEEIEEAKEEQEKLRLIEELELFCKFHFLSEENLLRRRGFPQSDWMEKLHHSLLVGLVNREVLLECAQGDPGAQANCLNTAVCAKRQFLDSISTKFHVLYPSRLETRRFRRCPQPPVRAGTNPAPSSEARSI